MTTTPTQTPRHFRDDYRAPLHQRTKLENPRSPTLSNRSDADAKSTVGTMTTIPITDFAMDDSKYKMLCGIETAGKLVVAGEFVLCCMMLIATVILAHKLSGGSFAGGFIGCLFCVGINMAITLLFLFGIKRSVPAWIVPYVVWKVVAIALCMICIVFFLAGSQEMLSVGGAVLFTILLMALQVPFLLVARRVYGYFYDKKRLYKKTLFGIDGLEDDLEIGGESERGSELGGMSPKSERSGPVTPLPSKGDW